MARDSSTHGGLTTPPNASQRARQNVPVTTPAVVRKVIRFGVFELDTRTGELRKHGVKLRLQGKPLQILQMLLERPGDIVTRDELRRRLWPSDVYVDVESGLNTAANRLRIALGDSAESPRYIETLARTGYRFIAPAEVSEPPTALVDSARIARRLRPRDVAIAATVAAVVAFAGLLLLRRPSPPEFRFRQVTFRHGQIWGARFAPDGQSILYTASWDSGPRQLFQTNAFSPESRSLGFNDFRLVSVSRAGELALLSFDGTLPIAGGTLARVPMNGGAPLAIERNIMSADWSPDGGRLAIVRAVEGTNQLEFPVGTVIAKTAGWISGVRVSRRGDTIAFIEHPVRNDNRGSVKVADLARSVRTLSAEWTNVGGIAWHPSGELWFTAARDGAPKSLWAVTLEGKVRPVIQTAGTMSLRDISPTGHVLASRDTALLEMAASVRGQPPRNLSWLDWSRVADVSADGELVVFDESGLAAGAEYLVYVHRRSDGSTVRLGEGNAMALSPDLKSVLVVGTRDRTRLRLLPLGEGKPVEVRPSGLEYQWVRYFPDGRRLLALANEAGRPLRLYVQPLVGGNPFPITPPTVSRNVAISPGGTHVAVLSANGKLSIYAAAPGAAGRHIDTAERLAPLVWPEENVLYVQHLGAYTQIPTRLSHLDVTTGVVHPWQQVEPADKLGVNAITKVMISHDLSTVVFNYRRVLSELFVIEPIAR